MKYSVSNYENNTPTMGRICAAPTAGSSGIMPAVIITGGEIAATKIGKKLSEMLHGR